MVDDDGRPTPAVVTAAVSIGTAPLPFLFVYAVLFVLHGTVSPVHPPDITNSPDGELVVGLITAALFVLATTTLVWFLNRRRRWPFAVVQLIVLGGCVDVIVDYTKGGRPIAVLLVLTTLVSLVLGFAPDSWTHVGRSSPQRVTALYGRLGLGGSQEYARSSAAAHRAPEAVLPASSTPSMVEPAALRRRRFATRGPKDP